MEKVKPPIQEDLNRGWMVQLNKEKVLVEFRDDLHIYIYICWEWCQRTRLGRTSELSIMEMHGLRVNTHLDQPNRMNCPVLMTWSAVAN